MRLRNLCTPITIDNQTWVYAEDSYATFVRQVRNTSGNHIQTEQIKVPAKVLRKLFRKSKAQP